MSNFNYLLPKILTQRSESCSSYAVAGAANWQFFNMGIALEVDADKLYAATTPPGEGQNLGSVLEYCKDKGLPLTNGTAHKISDFQRITVSWSWAEKILASGPAVFSMKIPLGLSLDQAIKPPNYTLDTIFKSHSLVLAGCDRSKQLFKVANSRSPSFGLNGYFFLPYFFFNQNYITDFYTFAI